MGWFSRSYSGMPLDTGEGWTEREWQRAPRKRVPVKLLVGTNRGHYLDEKLVARYARGGPRGDLYVVQHGGRYYIADGHHRAAAAISRGEKDVYARVQTV